MKVSSTFSIEINDLLLFNEVIKQKNLKRSTVLTDLIKEWLVENGNGQVEETGDDELTREQLAKAWKEHSN